MAMVMIHIPRVAIRLLELLEERGLRFPHPVQIEIHPELQDLALKESGEPADLLYCSGQNVAMLFANGIRLSAQVSAHQPDPDDFDSITIVEAAYVQMKQVGMDVSALRDMITGLSPEWLIDVDISEEDRWERSGSSTVGMMFTGRSRYLYRARFDENCGRRFLGLEEREEENG